MSANPRIHQVSCSLVSGPDPSAGYDLADQLCDRLARYARRLGFEVMSENVDESEHAMPLSVICQDADERES